MALPPQEQKLRILAIALSIVLLGIAIAAFLHVAPSALAGKAAFRTLYVDGIAVRSGIADHPRAATYPLYEAMLFAPLSRLPYKTAYLVFLALNLIVLAADMVMMWPYLLRLARVWLLLPVAMFVCFFAVTMSLIDGSDSIVLMAVATAAAVTFYKGKERTAGVLLGLTLFEPQYALPIALLFLAWRKWKIAGGFAVTATVLSLVTVWLARPATVLDFVHAMLGHHASRIAASSFPFALPNLHWMVQQIGIPSHGWSEGITIAISALLLVWTATRPPNFALASAVTLLVSYEGMAHDLVLLILPMGFILLSRVAQVSAREMFSKYVMGAMFLTPALLFFSAGAEYAVAASLLLLLIPLRSLY